MREQHSDKGIYLGVFAGEGEPVQLRYKGPKHIVVFGPPGASKSMGLVVPNIAHLPRSMIVIDPKGQLAAITARKRASMGRVIVLNPFGLFVDELPHLQSAGWNPLAQIDPQSPDFGGDARCIADAVIDRSAGGNNNVFFENAAENLQADVTMWERFSTGDKASLYAVRARLCLALHDTLKDMSECGHATIRNGGGRFYTRLTDENSKSTSVQDVVETVLSGTAFLEDERIGADMIGDAIDFGALHREITTIYLILPVHELQAQAKWLRMFVSLALRGLYKNPPTTGATLPPVLFVLDEFANLGRLQEIIKALGAARDYSIQLFMVLQNLSQLKANYEKEWPLFFAGSGAITAYAAKDMETAEEISKHCGDREEIVTTITTTGQSQGPQAIPLVRPEDVKRIEPGYTINMIEPCPWPVLARTPVYPETPYAAGLDPNPYYRG